MCRSGSVRSVSSQQGSGLGSIFKAFLGSAQVRVSLSNKIRVRVGSVQHIYRSLRVWVRIFEPVKTSTSQHNKVDAKDQGNHDFSTQRKTTAKCQ